MALSRRAFLGTGAAASLTAAPRPPLKISSVRTYAHKQAIVVRIATSDGAVGWGETAFDKPSLMTAFIHDGFKSEIVGQDAWDAERLWDRMFYANHDLGPGGALANAIAGVDLALWDLKARVLDVPVYKLLGGAYRDRVRAYGSFGVGFGRRLNPEQAAAQARKFVSKGLTAVKVRIQIRENRQNPDPDPTFDFVKAVRNAVGPKIELLVDINNGYTVKRAIEVGKRLYEEFGVRYYEEPVSDQYHENSAEVARALPNTYIVAGEKEYTRWQLRSLIVHGNVDYLNPDIVKAGGFTEMKKIAAMAQAFEKQIICHNTRPTFSTAASLHFLASISNCGPFVEYPDPDEFSAIMAVAKVSYRLESGFLTVPQDTGIGVEVDEPALRQASTVRD
jgi:L-alanine-DL-glutamate epimerase-like enolase superfamily enzyme